MKIIGHRGAAGLAPENTLKAIAAGITSGVDAVEVDLRLTKDGYFVLMHDRSLLRLAGSPMLIRDMLLEDLRIVQFFSGEPIASLEDALDVCHNTAIVLDMKGKNWATSLASTLRDRKLINEVIVISFNYKELVKFKKLMKQVPCYLLEHKHAFKAIKLAKQGRLDGVDLSFWVINPFTSIYARVNKLKIMTYTVNSKLLKNYLITFYNLTALTTDRPDKITS